MQAERYIPAEGAAAFEDGTLDFLEHPRRRARASTSSSASASTRSTTASRCSPAGSSTRSPRCGTANGRPLVRVYGPRGTAARGGTVTFNLLRRHRRVIDQDRIEQRAAEAGISLRTGCFCNPGAAEAALALDGHRIESCLDHLGPAALQHDFRSCLGAATGAVRVSVGWGTTPDDLGRLLSFLSGFTT